MENIEDTVNLDFSVVGSTTEDQPHLSRLEESVESSRSFETISESDAASAADEEEEKEMTTRGSAALQSSGYVITDSGGGGDEAAGKTEDAAALDDGPASLSSEDVEQMNREIGAYMSAIDQAMLGDGATFPNVAHSTAAAADEGACFDPPTAPQSGDLVSRVRAISTGSVTDDDVQPGDIDDEEDEEFEDESVAERLWALTEMFPDPVRKGAGRALHLSVSAGLFSYSWGRKLLWVGSTSFIVLLLPFIVETERVSMERESVNNQQQILLGPASNLPGSKTAAAGGVMPMPSMS